VVDSTTGCDIPGIEAGVPDAHGSDVRRKLVTKGIRMMVELPENDPTRFSTESPPPMTYVRALFDGLPEYGPIISIWPRNTDEAALVNFTHKSNTPVAVVSVWAINGDAEID
jgi:hypothetical protein